MASVLQETLTRLTHKSAVLVEKYEALRSERDALREQLNQELARLKDLQQQCQQLTDENRYLRMARTVATDTDELARYRAMVTQIVRDIDRCIAQLNT